MTSFEKFSPPAPSASKT